MSCGRSSAIDGRRIVLWLTVAAVVVLAIEAISVLAFSTSRPVSATTSPPVTLFAGDEAVSSAPTVPSRTPRLGPVVPASILWPAPAPQPMHQSLLAAPPATLPASVPTPELVEIIDQYLEQHSSPMMGLGRVLWEQGVLYKVDPRLLVAISGNETGFGRLLTSRYNAFNWFYRGTWDSHFSSWSEAITAVARGIRQFYFDDGRTSIEALGAKYGPIGAENDPENLNVNFIPNVTAFLRELGADPDHLTFD